MNNILFFDLEINKKTEKIQDIGAILNNNIFHSSSISSFEDFAKDAHVICGHNIFHHDMKFLKQINFDHDFLNKPFIDTLYLSALLFPEKPYHRLIKDYRLTGDSLNNPLSDSKLVQTLFFDIIEKFSQLPSELAVIYSLLLENNLVFKGFFSLINKQNIGQSIPDLISQYFSDRICSYVTLDEFIEANPVELAYSIALISTDNNDSLTPPWILHEFSYLPEILKKLRLVECGNSECSYCNKKLNLRTNLYNFFGYKNFRKFEYDDEIPLQEKVVRAGLSDKSLLAIFPTGGGKSLTFQLPALITGEANRSLTVVISPLQSLMKDQVDVLRKRFDITRAATINGLLSPLERSESIKRVFDGEVNLLYISPESLRSNTILNLLKNRHIGRFVIDEAHCFSSWGHDFRVDYLYISNFLKLLMKEKKLETPIPVSCFTATAKLSVIEDITDYFKEKLGIILEIFHTDAKRTNLTFDVFEVTEEELKYQKLVNLLMEKEGPKIVYVSRVKTTEELSEKLQRDGFNAKPYHGQLESDKKINIQNDFMEGKVDIIIATSAFGMGVDKDNVSLVVHYEISDSLENYVQESGRAGRREDLQASCYILFNETDLNKHFTLLNSTKLNQKEIGQIWRGIKNFKREEFAKSALEIAKSAGWDTEINDLETRVKTAIAVLEECGYVERGQNSARIFANSFLIRDVTKANIQIDETLKLTEGEKITAKRIFQHIITYSDTRVDYVSDVLGLEKEEVCKVLNILKEIKIIGDTKDLSAYINQSKSRKNSRKILEFYIRLEHSLLQLLTGWGKDSSRRIYLKEINESLILYGISDCSIEYIRNIFRYWSHKNYASFKKLETGIYAYNVIFKHSSDTTVKLFKIRSSLAKEVLKYLCNISEKVSKDTFSDNVLVEFSLLEIKNQLESNFFAKPYTLEHYESILLYLHEIGSIKLEGGLLIYYNPFNITRQEKSNQKQFTKEDFRKLELFYENKVEQIHIVGEYAKKVIKNYQEAMAFVDDYFKLDYKKFITKYFPERKTEIKRSITEAKFKELFGSLSTQQFNIITDSISKYILVAAGPGSGKTRILVHKIASLLLLEDVKPEQFLMLTFSRAAAMEFKTRLVNLVGNGGYYVDIFTYHSFSFNILGRLGNLERSDTVIKEATEAIKQGDNTIGRIDHKSVLVVDEFQDIGENEFALLNAIIKQAEDIRVIVVGDDDQNIYEFRGSSIKYMKEFRDSYNACVYCLDTNFRSKENLVDFANTYLECFSERMKDKVPIRANTSENGNIKIIKYKSEDFILPLVENIISSRLNGTTAVLTETNEEASLVETLLKQKGIPARLILSIPGFSMKNLIEIRIFTHYILNELNDELGFITCEKWNESKMKMEKDFSSSKNLALAMNVINEFEKNNDRKFKSEWKHYIDEIRLEDFYFPEENIVLVSTMHKAKGKEFDNVFLLLNNFFLSKEEKKRVLYVAITRAKENLVIHTNQNYFDRCVTKNFVVHNDEKKYEKPEELVLQLSLKDINLNVQKHQLQKIKNIHSGTMLCMDKFNILRDRDNLVCVKFSKTFEEKHCRYIENGYKFESSHAGFVVVWMDKDDSKEYRVILPVILYKRM